MAELIDKVYNNLYSSVIEKDKEEQLKFLSVISESRNISSEYLLNRKCIFIPNKEYVTYHVGSIAENITAGFYNNDEPIWQLFFIFPIMDLQKNIVGIVGWDAYNKYLVESGQELSLPMYRVSSKTLFNREKYFLTDIDLLEKYYKITPNGKRAIVVVDGVFDSVALNAIGVPAISLLGSSVSQEVFYFLRHFNYIYVAHDNDDAGLKLYKTIKNIVPNTFAITHHSKDIEERIRNDEKAKATLQAIISNPERTIYELDKRKFTR